MKILFLLLVSTCCFGQGIQKHDITIPLSKGEQLTMDEHKNFVKQNLPIVKNYFRRDSSQNKFISNVITPYLHKGDTVESIKVENGVLYIDLKKTKNK